MKTQRLYSTIFLIIISVIQSHAQSPMQTMSKYAGDWKASITMWMDPSQPPMTEEVKVHNEMIMNGLFLTSHYTGNMMDMPYEGLNTLAYDLEREMYVNTWIDNQNSGIAYSEGKTSAGGKTIEFHGTTYNSASGKYLQTRELMTLTDDTHQKIELFTSTNGKETETMEIDLTKQ